VTLNEQAGKPAKTVTIVHEDSAFGSGLAQLLNTQLPERGLLWQAVLDRKIDWIVSDHACCSGEQKWSRDDPTNIWLAKSGFGGTEYLLSGVVSEGSKRGMSYNHMAELLSWKPAQRFGLLNKGDIARGFDADIVLVDPHDSFVVRAADTVENK
jgi:allantoinase